MRRNYLHQLAIAIDQLFNTLLAGYADETLSARAYRMSGQKKRWEVIRKLIDTIFFWQDEHCYNSYLKEFEKGHRPSHYYNNQKDIPEQKISH